MQLGETLALEKKDALAYAEMNQGSSIGIIVIGGGFCVASMAVVGVLLYLNRKTSPDGSLPSSSTKKTEGDTNLDNSKRNLGNLGTSGDQLPPPSRHDERCVTNMGSTIDSGKCLALMYNHCIDGYKVQSKIPAGIRSAKTSILKQMYDNEKKWFDTVPTEWTTVCVARPDKAGSGPCRDVVPGEFRVWTKGRPVAGVGECDFSSKGIRYIKAHFNSDKKLQNWRTGTVGSG